VAGEGDVGRKSRAKALLRAERARNSASEPSEPRALPRHYAGFEAPADSVDNRSEPTALALPDGRTLKQVSDCNAKSPPTPIAMSPISGPASAAVDPASRLRALVAERRRLDRAVQHEVIALLHSGRSWTTIGRGLGLSRQGARQRYRRLLGRAS
jgi:hypothetical protein